MDNLQPWIQQAKAHWREFQPRLYRALVKAGTLNEVLRDAAQRTMREMDSLMERGLNQQEAWEMVREEYLFLPQEKTAFQQAKSEAACEFGPLTATTSSALRALLTGE